MSRDRGSGSGIWLVTSKCNLEREYRDCIKSRRDKVGITRHIIMHQVLYIVQLPNEEGDMHIIIIALGAL